MVIGGGKDVVAEEDEKDDETETEVGGAEKIVGLCVRDGVKRKVRAFVLFKINFFFIIVPWPQLGLSLTEARNIKGQNARCRASTWPRPS